MYALLLIAWLFNINAARPYLFMPLFTTRPLATVAVFFYCLSVGVCQNAPTKSPSARPKPLVTHIYTADPSAHVFNGTIYIYPSHDVAGNVPEDDEGAHLNMPLYFIPNSNRVSLNGRISTT